MHRHNWNSEIEQIHKSSPKKGWLFVIYVVFSCCCSAKKLILNLSTMASFLWKWDRKFASFSRTKYTLNYNILIETLAFLFYDIPYHCIYSDFIFVALLGSLDIIIYEYNLTKPLQCFIKYDIILDPFIHIFQVSEDGLRHEN